MSASVSGFLRTSASAFRRGGTAPRCASGWVPHPQDDDAGAMTEMCGDVADGVLAVPVRHRRRPQETWLWLRRALLFGCRAARDGGKEHLGRVAAAAEIH